MADNDYDVTLDLAASGPSFTEVAPSLFAWSPTVVRVEMPGRLVTLRLAQTPDGMRPTSVTIETTDGKAVTTAVVRSVPIGEISRAAIESAIFRKGDDGAYPLLPAAYIDASEGLRGPDHAQTLQRVAEIFELAQVLGVPPQKYVQDAFMLPRSTAGYWISQARKRGYLARPKVEKSAASPEQWARDFPGDNSSEGGA